MAAARTKGQPQGSHHLSDCIRPGSSGIDDYPSVKALILSEDFEAVIAGGSDRPNLATVADTCAPPRGNFEIAGEQRVNIDYPIGGTPYRTIKFRPLEHRDVAFRLVRRP